MGCSGPVCVLSGQPQCLQQQEEAAARATATTDGYQLFQKEPCTDLSPRQLWVSVCVCVCTSMCVLARVCVCCVLLSPGNVRVCAQGKQFGGVARGYSSRRNCQPLPGWTSEGVLTWTKRVVKLRGDSEMHLGYFPLSTWTPASMFYTMTEQRCDCLLTHNCIHTVIWCWSCHVFTVINHVRRLKWQTHQLHIQVLITLVKS